MDINAMYKIGYGLYLLSAASGGKDNACIVNTLGQVTVSPNRVSLTVNKLNLTHEMIAESGLFNVSVLSESAPFSVYERFGYHSGRDTDKLSGDQPRSENGLIYFKENANALISGRVVNALDLGTHTMFIADVTDCLVLSGEKSVTYDYYQSNVKPKPEKPKKTGWRCRICGYIYEGEQLPNDFICPICKHGAADFEKISV